MLKQKFVFAVSLVAMVMVGIGTARADIASTVYVQQGVNSAKTAANAAQTSANNANTAAVNAQDSADAAQEAADAAQASADAAAASAKTANDAVATKVTANAAITGATKAKITYDSKGLVTGGADLAASDIPTLATSKISGLDTALAAKEVTSNKVTTLSSSSTDTQYPSAKVVYTELAKKQNTLTIDSSLSSSSTNPVQNKVINTALAAKEASANKLKTGDTTTIGDSNKDTLYPTIGRVTAEIDSALAEVDNDIAALNGGLTSLQTTVSGKQATLTTSNVTTSGNGNVVTAVTAANGVVTVTKGTSLGSLATKSAVASGDITDGTIATADIANAAVTAAKTSGVIGYIPSGSATSTTYATIWVQ